jgi:catechol 2,3-dioxygenase
MNKYDLIHDPGKKTRAMKLGHVHLKVNHLDESLEFYRTVMDLSVTERHERYVFLSWGSSHHVIALQEGKVPPRPTGGARDCTMSPSR